MLPHFCKLSISFLAILITCPLKAQFNWVAGHDGAVIKNDFDSSSISLTRPSVLKIGDQFHMWYGRKGRDSVENVGHATSPNGINWSLVSTNVLGPSNDTTRFDAFDASHGWVIKDGDTLKMWYSGRGVDGWNIGLARSLDSENWTKVEGSGIGGSIFDWTMSGGESQSIAQPAIIKDDNGYSMWFTRSQINTGNDIAFATSPDGIDWTYLPTDLDQGAILPSWRVSRWVFHYYWPVPLRVDTTDYLWAVENNPTGPGGPIFGCRISCYESSGGIGVASIIQDGNIFKAWHILNEDSSNVIHYATSRFTASVPKNKEISKKVFAVKNLNGSSWKVNYKNPGDLTPVFKLKSLKGEVIEIIKGKSKKGFHIIFLNFTFIPPGVYLIELQIGKEMFSERIFKMNAQ